MTVQPIEGTNHEPLPWYFGFVVVAGFFVLLAILYFGLGPFGRDAQR